MLSTLLLLSLLGSCSAFSLGPQSLQHFGLRAPTTFSTQTLCPLNSGISAPRLLRAQGAVRRRLSELGAGKKRKGSNTKSEDQIGDKRNKAALKRSKQRGLSAQEQMKENEKQHLSECQAYALNFDPTLKPDQKREEFADADFQSLGFGENLIGPNNHPFNSQSLVHATAKPLFSKGECDAVIAEAEEFAAARGGWSTGRHYTAPTTDVLLQELPKSLEWFNRVIPSKLFPMIASRFPNVIEDPEKLRIFDVFVVKYDAEKQSYLSVHRDSSLISVTINLNSNSEFEGGGMWVEPTDQIVTLDQGHAVTFASNIRHAGNKISKGQRYILVGFLLYEGYVEHDRRLLQTSTALVSQGQLEEAEKVCRWALDLNPYRQEAWNNLAVQRRDQGDFEGAMESFEKAIGINKRYQEGWSNLGVCQGLAGNNQKAVETGRHAVSLNQQDSTSHYNLGCALAENGNLEEALSCFGEAITLNRRDGDAYHKMGEIRMMAGDLNGAVKDLKEATVHNSQDAAAFNDLGVALYESGEEKEALAAFRTAVELNPKDLQARENVAALSQYLGV